MGRSSLIVIGTDWTGDVKTFVSTPQRADRLWGLFRLGYSGRCVKLTTHHLSAEVKNDGAIPPLLNTSSWRRT
jgi:hypothetical protein